MMFRLVSVSATRLPQRRFNGDTSRLYKTMRHYSKEQQKSDLCPPPAPKKHSTGIGFTLGALALTGAAVIGYAKYDDDFRCLLTEYVPYTDDIIKFVFQEEHTYWENLKGVYDRARAPATTENESITYGKKAKKAIQEVPKDYHPPSPLFPSVAKDIKEPDVKYDEIRLESKDDGTREPNVQIVDPKPADVPLPDTHPKNLADLESKINAAAAEAVQAYNSAVYALRNYMQDVETIVESSVDRVDPSVWNSLKDKSKAKENAITKAETQAALATENLQKLKELLQKNDLNLSADVKEQAERNLQRVTHDITDAREELDKEKRLANVTNKYWHKVQEARKAFGDELQILFPHMNLEKKKWNITEGDLDLFVLQAMAKVLYYQKELHRLETLGDERLSRAVESAKKGGLEVLTTEQICIELDKERRNLEAKFDKKCLQLRQDSERDLRQQLKLQSEAFADHLSDAVKTREIEVERKLTRTFDEQLTEERCKFKMQVASMIGRLRGLDGAMRARLEADKSSHQAQVLWSACQALFKSVKVGCPGLPWSQQLRPLDPEIAAVQKAAANNDELVKVVINGIPVMARSRGVYPEDALRERFIKVEKVARKMALVPEVGGRLHVYFLSYLQSLLLVKAANPIPQSELNDEQTDFSNLSTNEILQRARYWLDRGDFAQTLRYMNLLQGAPRAVARQWMEETRILLETQQAANTLMAHAAANGLIYL